MYGKSVLFSRVVSFYIPRRTTKDSSKKLLEFLANMPKATSSRIQDAQRQRQQIAKKAEKYGPSTVYLQVLGSGARGVPNTLYMFTDQKRYLFNCGECTQRLAHEHKVKLSKLDHIFITTKTWRNIGGLPGLSLTLQDVGVPKITLHGPEGLDELFNATKRFVIMKDMQVSMAPCLPTEDFEDSVMTVKYVLLGSQDDLISDLVKERPAAKKAKLDLVDKQLEDFLKDDTDYYGHRKSNTTSNGPSARKNASYVKPRPKSPERSPSLTDKGKKKADHILYDLQKKSHCSVSYICTLKKRLGTLNLARCVELGVKPGPMLGQLKKGYDVVLADGTLVLAKDVKTPDDPGPVFIVLDVPDISYLKESEFSSHFDNEDNPKENVPSLIVHFTPPHVFHNPTYQSFMQRFGPTTRHLILNSQNSCLGSEAVHRTQHKLHLLDPDIFPLLKDVSVPAVWNSHPPLPKTDSPMRLKGFEELKNKIALAQFQNILNREGSCKGDSQSIGIEESDADKLEVTAGRTLTIYHLRAKKELDRSQEPKLHIQDYIQETMDVDGFVQSLEQFRRLVDSMRYARSGSAKEYPKVVFLGTGSCIPSKTRNTSAIVLHTAEDKSILLDCGEGTFGQLVRFYGPKKVNAFLKTLQAVYISHLHADHHIGLIGVLQARREAFQENDPYANPDPLYLLAPGQIMCWLTLYNQQFDRIQSEFTLVPNNTLLQNEVTPNPMMTPAMLNRIGVQEITTCQVSHCPNAFGVCIEVDRDKITYSGDTIPCDALVKLGQNSTLLIHEATMEDDLSEEARIKMHSTTTQAIEVGKEMNAKYTVLTHFSQRYARLPRLNPNILNDNNSVGIAFDNMQITINDLELLPHMYAPLQLMFAEHCVEMELKAAHRAMAKERERRAEGPIQQTDEPNRKQSPSLRSGNSALSTKLAFYRESNSSRLRQEIKGMSVSGAIGPPSRTPQRLQSRTQSQSRNLNNPSRKSKERPLSGRITSCRCDHIYCQQEVNLSAPARAKTLNSTAISQQSNVERGGSVHVLRMRPQQSQQSETPSSGRSTPCCRDNNNLPCQQKVNVIAPARTFSETSNSGSKSLFSPITKRAARTLSETSTFGSKCSNTMNTKLAARTMDETSNLKSKCANNVNTKHSGTSRHVVDTRSKTLNSTAILRQSNVERGGSLHDWRTKQPPSQQSELGNAYGKPLVTPVKKPLTLRREVTKSITSDLTKPYEKSPLVRARSPGLSKTADNRCSGSPTSVFRQHLSKIPVFSKRSDAINVLRSSCVISHTSPMAKSPRGTDASVSPSSSSRSSKTSSPQRCQLHGVDKTKVTIRPTMATGSKGSRETSAISPSWDSSTRIIRTRPQSASLGQVKNKTEHEPAPTRPNEPVSTQPSSARPSRMVSVNINRPRPASARCICRQKDQECAKNDAMEPETKNSMPSFRCKLNETLRKQQEKVIREDRIASRKDPLLNRPGSANHSVRSYKPQLEDIKSSFLLLNKKGSNNANVNQSIPPIPKPQPLDEVQRQKQLNEAKEKFRSQTFLRDSKYDKIEGLNWISWK